MKSIETSRPSNSVDRRSAITALSPSDGANVKKRSRVLGRH